MSFFSSLKKAVSKVGAPVRGMKAVTPPRPVPKGKAIARAIRSVAARAPTTPFATARAQGWRAPAGWKGAAAAYRGGGAGGGAGRSDEEFFEEDDDPPATASPPDWDEDDGAELGGVEVYRRHFREMQLEGWTDDLAKIGVDLAKGAASGALTTVARGLSPTVAPKAPPPPPPGMSTTAKLAIGAAVAVPVLYLLTRKRSSPTPVAA